MTMIHHSSITDADRKFVETWENISENQTAIIKITPRGEETHQLISGARTFLCTTEERLLTQDRIVDSKDDPFQNGSFRPLVAPDTITIESNPNALSDDEVLSVLQSSDVAWTEWLRVLDSPATLQRLLDRAEEANASLRRYREVEAKLTDVRPKTRITQKDREQFEKIAGA